MKIKNIFLLAALAIALPMAAVAAETKTLCSGESAEVKLDLATGTMRTPAATETLTYSTEWDGGSTVTLAVNDAPLASGLTGSGTYDWTPSGTGLFTLTHTATTSGGDEVLTALFEIPLKVAKNTTTGTEYTSVQAAFDEAAANETIELITDVTENVMITTAKTNTLDLAGHVLKGIGDGTAPVITINSTDAAITIRDTSSGHTGAITAGGETYSGNGAGVNLAAGSLSLYDVTITNCVASGNGGAVYQAQYANLLMSGCTVKNNTAVWSGGGIYKQGGCSGLGAIEAYFGKCVLLQTEVVGNTAGASGGGVYFQKMMEKSSCFAAGTLVTMADGTTKAIEDVKEGDVVKTLDHEGGTNSSARVFIWLKEAVATRAFTLAFADGYFVNCVLTHDFLMKDGENSCKYVCLGRANAADYVGKLFYGVDGQWHELLGVTDGEEVSEIYEIYTAQHFNSYANGMLTVPADVEANLNLYKLDANLKADADQLAADVAKYGYYSYEDAAAKGASRAYYDDAGIKYVNVIVGKGLATWEELEEVYASAQALTSTASTPASNVPCLTASATASKLAAADAEPTLDDYVAGWLVLGADVIITNNTASGAKSNIYLATANSGADSLIQLAASHDGICAGVTCDWGSGMFTTDFNVIASDVALFTSDSSAYAVKFVTDHLELVSVVTFTPTAVDHTMTAVYLNDEPAEKSGESYQIESNATAKVVYTADDGYAFADGSTAVTNDINTMVNPATAEAPAAPVKQLRYVAPVYVDDDAANGIDHWVTNVVPNGYTVVTSSEDVWMYGWYVVTADVQIDGGVECVGDVHLVLCDGAKLTVTNCENNVAGIATDASGSFTIYGTPEGAGELSATSSAGGAGIGGSNSGDGSHITINGGTVTATGTKEGYDGGGAGIGGGYYGVGSDIVINGGVVRAESVTGGAGIGGGYCKYGSNKNGSDIVINGGIVYAESGSMGAGIGGGAYAVGSGIVINGGDVTAKSLDMGAGIGGGYCGNGLGIAINGGDVTAMSFSEGAGIGGGGGGCATNIAINAGTVSACAVMNLYGTTLAVADFIGSGYSCVDGVSENVTIADSANVCFNLTGFGKYTAEGTDIESPTPMPETFEGFVIMTPSTQTVSRVLVGGAKNWNWTTATTFALTNAVTAATRSMAVGGYQRFANANLALKHAENKVALNIVDATQVGDDAWAHLDGASCAVFGSGAMWDASEWAGGKNPLATSRRTIRSVDINQGVTAIGSQFFHKFYNLANVTCAASVTSVGDYAFFRCNSLERMTFATAPSHFGTGSYTLQAAIYMKENGLPEIYTIPAISIGGYRRKLLGTVSLTKPSWQEVTDESEKQLYHFFKIQMVPEE